MISEEKLRDLVLQYNYFKNNHQFFEKKLKTVYTRGIEENIKDVLSVLDKYNLLYLIDKCSSILVKGKHSEIESIIIFLERKEQLDLLKDCPSILAEGKEKNIKSIFNILKENKLLDLLEKCPYILARGKVNEIENILNLFKEESSLSLLRSCPIILAKSKEKNIKSIFDILEENKLLDLLEKCPYILVRSKVNEVENILNFFKEKGLLSLLKSCPYILAQGKKEEIENIFKLLEEKELLNLLKTCPTILAEGKEKNIKSIFNILEENKLLDLLERCPYILVRGKANEIKNILNLLEKKGLLNILKSCPFILATGKIEEIKESFALIDSVKGDINGIGGIYLLYPKLLSIIVNPSKSKGEKNFYQNCFLHLKLIGNYNKILKKEDIYKLSNDLKITYKDFIINILGYIGNEETINNILNTQGYIYFGTCSITKEDLNKHASLIMEITERLAKKYTKLLNIDYIKLRDFFFDKLIEKAGAIFINFGNTYYLEGALINFLKACMPKVYQTDNIYNVSFQLLENTKIASNNINYEEEIDKNFLENYTYLNKEDIYFLSRISYFIENGDSYIDGICKEFGYTLEEFGKKIESIKHDIENHVNQNKRKY